MAHATRCPHCQTAFKVVRDQLLLREGWVRCGHCGEPFNALDHLIDLSPPASVSASTSAEQTAAAPTPTSTEASSPPLAVPIIAGLHWDHIPVDQPAYQGFLPLTAQAYDMKPQSVATAQASGEPDKAQPGVPVLESVQDAWPVGSEAHQGIASEFPAQDLDAVSSDHDLAADRRTAEANAVGAEVAPLSEFNLNDALNYRFDTDDASAAAATSPAQALATAQEPEFVRQAHRQARWRSAPVRVALGAASLLLLLLLGGQAALFWRDALAQQWPASRPWLQQFCRVTTGCELAAPRDLDALVIDSSALSPTETGLQLTVLLRNRLDRAVAWPALELTLTDAQGRIAQRKVVEPAHYLFAAQATGTALRAGIAPGQQMQLQLHLALRGAAPAGYKLVLFYP